MTVFLDLFVSWMIHAWPLRMHTFFVQHCSMQLVMCDHEHTAARLLRIKSFVVHHNLHTVVSKVEIDRKSVPFRYCTRTALETSLIGHCVHSLNRYDCDWHQ